MERYCKFWLLLCLCIDHMIVLLYWHSCFIRLNALYKSSSSISNSWQFSVKIMMYGVLPADWINDWLIDSLFGRVIDQLIIMSHSSRVAVGGEICNSVKEEWHIELHSHVTAAGYWRIAAAAVFFLFFMLSVFATSSDSLRVVVFIVSGRRYHACESCYSGSHNVGLGINAVVYFIVLEIQAVQRCKVCNESREISSSDVTASNAATMFFTVSLLLLCLDNMCSWTLGFLYWIWLIYKP